MQPVFLVPPDSLEYVPENYLYPLDLVAVFPGRSGLPLEIDLGAGDGDFILEMVKRHPERNFLAVERLMGRLTKICRKLARIAAPNARTLRIESHYFVRYLLPPGSVNIFHIMHPDPWPKRRHHGNRLIQTEFLDVVHRALAPGGELRLTTDNEDYFKHMRAVFEAHPGFVEEPWDPGEEYPQTDFERQYRAKGQPIFRALLRRG
ncbi:MAG: tRNA (guanine(46)-N(7))-methyltransferase TrmB [Chthoniobacteraceae bacterium]